MRPSDRSSHRSAARRPAARAEALAAVAAAFIAGLGTLPARAQPAMEGRVLQVLGDVRVDAALAKVGAAVGAAEVHTGADGRVQLRLADGSVVALPPSSQLHLDPAQHRLVFGGGGLRLNAVAGATWTIELPGRSVRTDGYFVLRDCAAGCRLEPGLYGAVAQGEAVLEYQGGRAVLRNRSFRWVDAQSRPDTLPRRPALLDDTDDLPGAAQARVAVADQLKAGIEAFGADRDAEATQALEAVRAAAPGETLVPYYLGLIALRAQHEEDALRLLQQYAREDPDGAAARDVPKTLTLLSSAQLQHEVATAVSREKEVASSPPEPDSIAVQAFVNHGNEAYRAMAKGLAAMIIADLSKVPGLKVLEREKVQLLVDEARLGDSGLADTASAVRSGRLMRAEKVVVGNFEVQQ